MPANPYEERVRAVKAAKLARIASRVLANVETDDSLADEQARARTRGQMVETLPLAPPDFRARVARLAGTTPPSDRTWEIVCAMVEAEATT